MDQPVRATSAQDAEHAYTVAASPGASSSPLLVDRSVPPAGNDLFLRNMRALWRVDPWLALRVDAVRDEDRRPVEPAKKGGWTVRAAVPDGPSLYLHSRYDPVAEARTFAEAVTIEDKFCFVVSGLGLGYHILALHERLTGDVIIVCVEPSIRMIATALTRVDLSELIASRRFILLTDDDKARLHDRLQAYNTLIMLGAQFIQHAPSVRLAASEHAAVSHAISEFVTYTRMTLMTLVANSQITCKNIAMNAVTYVSTPPIDLLRNRFSGDPAIIVSAGPSLLKNIDQLKGLKGRAVLIAVQTALRPLMQRGIVPDFVTSLDFHEMSRKFFEGVGDLSDVHLVAEPKATWHVLDNYPGPISLLENSWARMVLGDDLAARGGLKAGATVAHLAFYLAVHLGCDPIVFVGQDLAFTGHVFYVPGVEIHHAWRTELNRFNTIEHKEWERIVRNRPILRKVSDAQGRSLYTDELLFTYLEQFETDVAELPNRVVDATEGGACIRGTEAMSLDRVAAEICTRDIDPERFAYRRTMTRRNPARLPAVRDVLTRRIEQLDRVVTTCDELLEVLGELEGLADDADRFNKRLLRVDELRARIDNERDAYRIVNVATQLAEFRRFSADRRLSTTTLDDAERARRQIKRDVEFITAVRDGALTVKPMLTASCDRVEKAIERS